MLVFDLVGCSSPNKATSSVPQDQRVLRPPSTEQSALNVIEAVDARLQTVASHVLELSNPAI